MSDKKKRLSSDSQISVTVECGGLEPFEVLCNFDELAEVVKRHYLYVYPETIDNEQKAKLVGAVDAYQKWAGENGDRLTKDQARTQLLLLYAEMASRSVKGYLSKFVNFGIQAAFISASVKAEQMAHKLLGIEWQISAAEVQKDFAWLIDEVKDLTYVTGGRPPKNKRGRRILDESSAQIKEQIIRAICQLRLDRESVTMASVARRAGWFHGKKGNPTQTLKDKLKEAGVQWKELKALAAERCP